MLELDRQTARFVNINLRAEKHGDENVTGADLKLSIVVSNDVLAEFHPSLKSSFFRAPHPGEMDMVDQAEADEDVLPLNRLLFGSRIGAVKWDDETVGAGVTVHYGVGGSSDIELLECGVDSFTLNFMDGGSVAIAFRVKCTPDEKQVAKLSVLLGHEIEVSMTPPDPDSGPIGDND